MSEMILDPADPSVAFVSSGAEPLFGAQVGPVTLRNVHAASVCVGEPCLVHNPSNHHMRGWPLNWRDDAGVMERVCPHGVGHPDPDSAAFHERNGRGWMTSHGCDGCCFLPST